MQQGALLLQDRQEAHARDDLLVVGRERLALAEDVGVPAEVEEDALLRQVAQPLDAVGEERHGGDHGGGPLHRPARVAHHDHVQRDAFLAAAHEHVSLQLGNGDHHAGLAGEPFVVGAVVHEPRGPGDCPSGLDPPVEQDAEVAKLPVGLEVELLAARVVLCVGAGVQEHAGTDPQREERTFVLVPLDEPAGRRRGRRLTGLLPVLDGRRLRLLRGEDRARKHTCQEDDAAPGRAGRETRRGSQVSAMIHGNRVSFKQKGRGATVTYAAVTSQAASPGPSSAGRQPCQCTLRSSAEPRSLPDHHEPAASTRRKARARNPDWSLYED